MTAPTGTTQLTAVIGSPVRHSLSPTLHNAAFEAAQLDWVMLAFEVGRGSGAAAVEAMRTFGLRGLAVTMPHKSDVAAAVDAIDPAAAALGSVNTVVLRDDGTTFGTSTDGEGFVASLLAQGIDPAGARVALLGAGAAARAVDRRAGASRRRRPGDREPHRRRRRPGGRAGATGSRRRRRRHQNGRHRGQRHADRDGHRRAGVRPGTPRPAPDRRRSRLPPVGDRPAASRARRRSTRRRAGSAMLVHQAVLQHELWTGERPDPAVMRAATEGELVQAPRITSPGCSDSSPPASRTVKRWWS